MGKAAVPLWPSVFPSPATALPTEARTGFEPHKVLTGKRAGRWYAIGDTRKAFIADKTAGEACLKLTMVAMAKELSMRGKTEAHAAMFTPRALLQVDSLLGGYPCLADAVAGRSGKDMSSAPWNRLYQ